ncbi:MAG: potassium-transporting ATPase subunit KdpA [Bryobacterales bacterium]|nr:potassium-transporting ATPase subunit KdpA [Bryobacterales bacterium]MBV9401182.1 potassium-transporting ATPase subunit KdpA [Bryobacterales bacterium]
MTSVGILQIFIFLAIILACAKPLGGFMANVFNGERTFLHPLLRWLEVLTYKAIGVREDVEQRWTQYTAALLSFSVFGFLLTYAIQRLQGYLPFNPQGFGAAQVSPDLAFNTAASFVTNTNWQSYTGESTLSYFVQMSVLTVQNFASAAAGIAIAIALIRGFTRQEKRTVGNFWVDVTRATVYVLLPLAVIAALLYCSQGVIQNLKPYTTLTTVEGAKQVIAQGPVASQEAIKQLGTNGGGFFNANAAHPFENPTPLSNLLAMVLIFLIPGALTYTFGKMVGDTRQGWAIFAAFSAMFLIGVFVAYHYEQAGNPNLTGLGIQNQASAGQPGGNMEGKELRFGIANSALFATVTTDASCGAINSWHDSFTALGGLVPMFNMMTGEVIFGGVGAGLYGILLYCIIAVFIAGLMVGRTPEYLGKKIEQKEVKMAMLAIIATAFSILVFSAISMVADFHAKGYWNPPGAAAANINNSGPHGLSEILYAYVSATANNGSAFAGLNTNTPWYNLTLGLAMIIGRFLFLIPLLAAAGSLAAKKKIPVTAGTFPTHGPLFVGLLVGTVILVGALTFFPALSLGPIVEHFLMQSGKLFSMIPVTQLWS